MESENENQPKRHPKREFLFQKAKELPLHPGVYLMKNVDEQVIYVGKAKALRNRVKSYFLPLVHEHPRTELLLTNVNDFEVIHTETETEALVLECTLIKKFRPKFNVRLKDDKHYPYLRISKEEEFPRIEWTRKVGGGKARYFGPFPSGYSARIVLRLLTEKLKLRDCSDNTFRHRSRACILYQMEKCSGPCVGHVTKDEYSEQMAQAIKILEGKQTAFLKGLKKEMMLAAEEERFEDAGVLRDQLQAIEVVSETQSVEDPDRRLDVDVFCVVEEDGRSHACVLQVRGGKLMSVKHYAMANSDLGIVDSSGLELLIQHLDFTQGGDLDFEVRKILMKNPPEDREELEMKLRVQWLMARTAYHEQLLRVAETNARMALKNAKKDDAGHGVEALEELMRALDLERIPNRMECYDISNFQGDAIVASRVVFIEGTPDKNLYRRYKIETVKNQNDDFKSMLEVMQRRFEKLGEVGNEKPDLVVIDGGRGQLKQAERIFESLDVQGVSLVSLAKARTVSDFKSKEVESSSERVFIPGRVNPVPLYPHTKAYKLLTHIRDEAHRFAISYHRTVRDKGILKGK